MSSFCNLCGNNYTNKTVKRRDRTNDGSFMMGEKHKHIGINKTYLVQWMYQNTAAGWLAAAPGTVPALIGWRADWLSWQLQCHNTLSLSPVKTDNNDNELTHIPVSDFPSSLTFVHLISSISDCVWGWPSNAPESEHLQIKKWTTGVSAEYMQEGPICLDLGPWVQWL